MRINAKDRRLTRLFTAAVLGEWEQVRAVRRAAPQGEPDREWRETVLQVHLFAGFPRLVQCFGVLAEEGGLGQPTSAELEPVQPDLARGRALFDTIYGEGAGKLRELLASYHADFADWIEQHAYTRVLARPGLSAARRELLASCALAALGQDRQLASHARGSLRCGADYEELIECLELVADLIPAERMLRAKRIVERFSDERG